jgi:hypothetical protein
MPIYVKTRVVASWGTVIEYFPLASVLVPIVVPLTNTVTPTSAPSEATDEVTVPVMTFVCEKSVEAQMNTNKKVNDKTFFIGKRLIFILKLIYMVLFTVLILSFKENHNGESKLN